MISLAHEVGRQERAPFLVIQQATRVVHHVVVFEVEGLDAGVDALQDAQGHVLEHLAVRREEGAVLQAG